MGRVLPKSGSPPEQLGKPNQNPGNDSRRPAQICIRFRQIKRRKSITNKCRDLVILHLKMFKK